jgi:dinuclear metal center YbgI/SA1388 family protein
MPRLKELIDYFDSELRTSEIPDSDAALNGLQLENSGRVTSIAATVDFSARAIEAAVDAHANLLILHHGMYWRGVEPLVGINLTRLSAALAGDIAIYSSHIPLDLHPELGNNAQLARELRLDADGTFGRYKTVEIGVTGRADLPTRELFDRVAAFSARFATTALCSPAPPEHRTRRWAIITGAGASPETMAEARARGVDTLIVGEGPHHTAVEAMERGPVVIYGGHYATETLGVRALARRAGERFDLPWTFIDLPTGL